MESIHDMFGSEGFQRFCVVFGLNSSSLATIGRESKDVTSNGCIEGWSEANTTHQESCQGFCFCNPIRCYLGIRMDSQWPYQNKG